MSDQSPAVEAEQSTPEPEVVPADRFREVAKHKKAAEERAKTAERQIAELQAQIEDREHQNLPELDKLQKALAKAEERAQQADQRAADLERSATNLRKEGWVTAAARELDFIDPEDALNPRHVSLDDIESREDAERVLKRVAKAKQHLIKREDPPRPEIGRVLQNGRQEDVPGATRAGDVGLDLNDPATKRALGEEMLGILQRPKG